MAEKMSLSTFANVDNVFSRRLTAPLVMVAVGFVSGCAHPPPPLMPAYDPQAAVEICAGGECGKAGEKFALDDIASAIADLFKANGPGLWDFCVADPGDRRCIQNELSYTVYGAFPATGTVPNGALRAGAKYDGKRGVSFRVNVPTIVLGTASVCDDARSILSVRSPNNILWHSNPYLCSWGGGDKTIKAEGRYGIDYIDFDRGVMGGEFTIRVSEGGNGFTQGYAVTRLSTGMEEVQEVWLRPKKAQTVVLASPSLPANSPPEPESVPAITSLASLGDIDFGNYHALVIGSNEYQYLPKLKTAVNDATAVAAVLQNEYGFKVKLMLNAGALEIVDAFDELRETLNYDDNLLIYCAGHGWLDEETGQGYWLPIDAKPNRRSRWVSNSTLKDTLKALAAKHVMVVADSCFSGTLTRGAHIGIRGADYLRKIAAKQARVAITSGGLEPVADSSGRSQHSPFAKAFIETLRGNTAVMDGTTLFNQIRRPIMVATEQTPAYSDVRNAGHDGGDFLFVRKE